MISVFIPRRPWDFSSGGTLVFLRISSWVGYISLRVRAKATVEGGSHPTGGFAVFGLERFWNGFGTVLERFRNG